MLVPTAMTILMVGGLAESDLNSDRDAGRIETLEREVQTLRDQVSLLRGDSPRSAVLSRDTQEIRALVYEAVADASSRVSLQGDAGTAGWDKKFYLASPDGSFKMTFGGQVQFRYAFSSRDDASVDTSRGGFEIRRAKLKFKGHAIDPTIKFTVVGAFSRSSGDFGLEDAKITKKLNDGWSVSFGQFKGPFMREELVSSSKQLTVDRSLVNEEFNQDRLQGVEIAYQSDQFAFKGAFSDGFNSDNTAALNEDTEFALTGRAEFLGSGNWKQFSDFTSWRDDEFGFLLGVAGHYEVDEYGTATANEETFTWTADASLEFGGANLFAAVVGRHRDLADTDQYGVVVQGGYFLTDDLEAFGRYEHGDFDTTGVDDLSVITAGVNKYWNKHNLKWTTDIGYALDPVHDEWDSSGVAWLENADGNDGQFVVRSQVQLLF